MRMKNSHYTNYLISVQFDRGFVPDSLSGMMERCDNFLEDLGNLARKHGRRLHSTLSIATGLNGHHAHFGLSWLPLSPKAKRASKSRPQAISRYTVTRLLEDNYFYVDNPTEAIKKVTHDKSFVTDYIITQPKDGQNALYDDFYIHPDFVPVYSEKKIHSYCSKQQMRFSKRTPKRTSESIAKTIILAAWLTIFLISYLLLSIF